MVPTPGPKVNRKPLPGTLLVTHNAQSVMNGTLAFKLLSRVQCIPLLTFHSHFIVPNMRENNTTIYLGGKKRKTVVE